MMRGSVALLQSSSVSGLEHYPAWKRGGAGVGWAGIGRGGEEGDH